MNNEVRVRLGKPRNCFKMARRRISKFSRWPKSKSREVQPGRIDGPTTHPSGVYRKS